MQSLVMPQESKAASETRKEQCISYNKEQGKEGTYFENMFH